MLSSVDMNTLNGWMVEKLPRIGTFEVVEENDWTWYLYVNLHKQGLFLWQVFTDRLTSTFIMTRLRPFSFLLIEENTIYIELTLPGILKTVFFVLTRQCDSEILSDLVVHDVVLLCYSTLTRICVPKHLDDLPAGCFCDDVSCWLIGGIEQIGRKSRVIYGRTHHISI